jgi:two-component system CheB/CheR fusion protein
VGRLPLEHRRQEGPPWGAGSPDGPAPGNVVGVGAAAGGVEALARLCAGLDPACDAAFVVLLRPTADPERGSLAALAGRTGRPVHVVEDGARPEPGGIYLVPPETSATFRGERIRLVSWPPGAAPALPIDDFFVSLAESRGRRAVGIVLSGAGADGARGVRALHAAGGVVLVQEERSARHDGMPRAAIATGVADAILPPEAMGACLALRRASGKPPAPPADESSLEPMLADMLASVGAVSRVDFTQYKASALLPRIERRMALTHAASPTMYARLLRGCPSEVRLLERDLLIGTTRFFRDAETFEHLLRETLPAVIAAGPVDEPLRLWVPACSTGEEAYTVAMLAAEALEAAGSARGFKVFATDVDPAALEVASVGEYPLSISADVSPRLLDRWFVRREDAFAIVRELRSRVLFAAHDVTRDAPFLRVDLVSCRNLLIYLEAAAQRRALSSFHDALRPGRPLLLGPTEGVGELPGAFRLEAPAARIFHRLPRAPEPKVERAPVRGTPRNEARPATPRTPADEALRWLGAEYGPPAVLLGPDGTLLHSFGAAARWMSLPVGRATLSAFDLLPSGLAVAVREACAQAFGRCEPARVPGVRFETPNGPCRVDVRVVPFPEAETVVRCLVVFEPLLMPVESARREPLRVSGGRAAQGRGDDAGET